MSEHEPNVPQQPEPPQPPAPPSGEASTPAPPPAPPPPQGDWQQGPSGPRASFGRRLVALIVDDILISVVAGIAIAIFGVGVGYGLYGLFGLLYFALLEGGARGQTLGKMALGIRVIDFNTGGPIGYARGFLRYVGKIISGVVCALGYLWMLWDKEKQTWHDKIATTVVVPVQYYPVS
jgi:uncharacterized RDD family membrane protein YckC